MGFILQFFLRAFGSQFVRAIALESPTFQAECGLLLVAYHFVVPLPAKQPTNPPTSSEARRQRIYRYRQAMGSSMET